MFSKLTFWSSKLVKITNLGLLILLGIEGSLIYKFRKSSRDFCLFQLLYTSAILRSFHRPSQFTLKNIDSFIALSIYPIQTQRPNPATNRREPFLSKSLLPETSPQPMAQNVKSTLSFSFPPTPQFSSHKCRSILMIRMIATQNVSHP